MPSTAAQSDTLRIKPLLLSTDAIYLMQKSQPLSDRRLAASISTVGRGLSGQDMPVRGCQFDEVVPPAAAVAEMFARAVNRRAIGVSR